MAVAATKGVSLSTPGATPWGSNPKGPGWGAGVPQIAGPIRPAPSSPTGGTPTIKPNIYPKAPPILLAPTPGIPPKPATPEPSTGPVCQGFCDIPPSTSPVPGPVNGAPVTGPTGGGAGAGTEMPTAKDDCQCHDGIAGIPIWVWLVVGALVLTRGS